MKKTSFIFLLLLIPLVLRVADFEISNSNPEQGDAVAIYFKNSKPQSVVFDSQSLPVFRYKNFNVAVFPVAAAKAPGLYPLKIVFGDNDVSEKQIRVKARKFSRVVLGIPKELGFTPQALGAKLESGQKNLENVVRLQSEDIFFDQPFGLPLRDNRKIGSPFGEIRQTGSEEIRHLGVDFAAPLGAPVAAIENGLVRKTYFDAIYGNAVIIDHGHGLFSAYLHLDKIKARENDAVKKGSIIGSVGQTGYATAPHLHLSIKVNGVSVDPLRFVSAFK